MQGVSFWGKDLELVSRIYCGRGWEWSVCRAQVLDPRGKACCWATKEPVLSSLFSRQSLLGPCVPVVCGISGLSPSAGKCLSLLNHPDELRLWTRVISKVISFGLWRGCDDLAEPVFRLSHLLCRVQFHKSQLQIQG